MWPLGPGIPDRSANDAVSESPGHRLPSGYRVVTTPILGGLHHEYGLEANAVWIAVHEELRRTALSRSLLSADPSLSASKSKYRSVSIVPSWLRYVWCSGYRM
jgi:hypothetical protein